MLFIHTLLVIVSILCVYESDESFIIYVIARISGLIDIRATSA
jgi:hypothetical protein